MEAGAEAGSVGVMAPPDVPEGEVDGDVIGAGVVVVPDVSGFGPHAPSANREDSASESVVTDLRGANDMEIPFKRVTAMKEFSPARVTGV